MISPCNEYVAAHLNSETAGPAAVAAGAAALPRGAAPLALSVQQWVLESVQVVVGSTVAGAARESVEVPEHTIQHLTKSTNLKQHHKTQTSKVEEQEEQHEGCVGLAAAGTTPPSP